MKFVSLFLVAMLSLPATAADTFTCTADVFSRVDSSIFKRFQFTIRGERVDGGSTTARGWINISKEYSHAQLTARLEYVGGVPRRISLAYGLGLDYAELAFDIVEGKTVGTFYEFIDCRGESHDYVEVECVRIAP